MNCSVPRRRRGRRKSAGALAAALLLTPAAGLQCLPDTRLPAEVAGNTPVGPPLLVRDVSECAQTCIATLGCRCWTHVSMTRRCWLLGGCNAAVSTPALTGFTSGTRGCDLSPLSTTPQLPPEVCRLEPGAAAAGGVVGRGPDWEWEEQDGGAFGVLQGPGAVCAGGGLWWRVLWEGQTEHALYRVGCDGKHDLAPSSCAPRKQGRPCSFNDVTLPTGIEPLVAEAGAGCRPGGTVPDGSMCGFVGEGLVCDKTVCYDGVWTDTTPLCSALPGHCSYDRLAAPKRAVALTLVPGCQPGGSALPGRQCAFHLKHHSCSVAVCSENGSWVPPAPACVSVRPATCRFRDIKAPAGSLASGSHCRSNASAAVGEACHFRRTGYTCHAALCGADGKWTPAAPKCMPNGCVVSGLVVPFRAQPVGPNCTYAGSVVRAGGLCRVQRPGHRCEPTTCSLSPQGYRWAPVAPTCVPEAAVAPPCAADVAFNAKKPENVRLEPTFRTRPTAESCSDACSGAAGCKCFTWNGRNQRCWLMRQCGAASQPGALDSFVSGAPGCRLGDKDTPPDCRLQSRDLVAGTFVTRGPDWRWGDQDGGGVGVIVARVRSCPGGLWMAVLWENSGVENNYRVGCAGKHDLCRATHVPPPVPAEGRGSSGRGGRGGGRGAVGRGSASGTSLVCTRGLQGSSRTVTRSLVLPSLAQCTEVCARADSCRAASFHAPTSRCRLHSATDGEAADDASLLCRQPTRTLLAANRNWTCEAGAASGGSEDWMLTGVGDARACAGLCATTRGCLTASHRNSSCTLMATRSRPRTRERGATVCQIEEVQTRTTDDDYVCGRAWDAVGEDLAHLTDVQTRSDCSALCSRVDGCVATVRRGTVCSLKAEMSEFVQLRARLQWEVCVRLRQTPPSPVCRAGVALEGATLLRADDVDSAERCWAVCAQLRSCSGSVLANGTGTCTLRTGPVRAVPTAGAGSCAPEVLWPDPSPPLDLTWRRVAVCGQTVFVNRNGSASRTEPVGFAHRCGAAQRVVGELVSTERVRTESDCAALCRDVDCAAWDLSSTDCRLYSSSNGTSESPGTVACRREPADADFERGCLGFAVSSHTDTGIGRVAAEIAKVIGVRPTQVHAVSSDAVAVSVSPGTELESFLRSGSRLLRAELLRPGSVLRSDLNVTDARAAAVPCTHGCADQAEVGYDCPAASVRAGALLRRVQCSSRRDCAEECDGTARCAALVFDRGACSLHEVGDTASIFACVRIAGPVPTVPFTCTAAATHDVADELPGLVLADDPSSCIAACTADKACTAVTISPCRLWRTVREGAAELAAASCVRTAAQLSFGDHRLYDCRSWMRVSGDEVGSALLGVTSEECRLRCDLTPQCAVAAVGSAGCRMHSSLGAPAAGGADDVVCAKGSSASELLLLDGTAQCQEDTWMEGAVLREDSGSASVEACSTACAATEGCAAAVHVDRSCALLSSAAAPARRLGATSCVVRPRELPQLDAVFECAARARVHGVGGGVRKWSAEGCAARCLELEPACSGFAYDSGVCWVLRGQPVVTAGGGVVCRRRSGGTVRQPPTDPRCIPTPEFGFVGGQALEPAASDADSCSRRCAAADTCHVSVFGSRGCVLGAAAVPLGGAAELAEAGVRLADLHSGLACWHRGELPRWECSAGWALAGSPIATLKVRDTTVCEDRCASTPGCALVSALPTGACELHAEGAARVSMPGSAVCRRSAPLPPDFDCTVGGSVGDTLARASRVTAAECAALCTAAPGCSSASSSPDGTCALHTAGSGATTTVSDRIVCARRAVERRWSCTAGGGRGSVLVLLESVTSARVCTEQCDAVAGCAAAVLEAGACVLLAGVVERTSGVGTICTRADQSRSNTAGRRARAESASDPERTFQQFTVSLLKSGDSLGLSVGSDLRVTSVAAMSTSFFAGVLPGDRVLSVGGAAVSTPAELSARVASLPDGPLFVAIERELPPLGLVWYHEYVHVFRKAGVAPDGFVGEESAGTADVTVRTRVPAEVGSAVLSPASSALEAAAAAIASDAAANNGVFASELSKPLLDMNLSSFAGTEVSSVTASLRSRPPRAKLQLLLELGDPTCEEAPWRIARALASFLRAEPEQVQLVRVERWYGMGTAERADDVAVLVHLCNLRFGAAAGCTNADGMPVEERSEELVDMAARGQVPADAAEQNRVYNVAGAWSVPMGGAGHACRLVVNASVSVRTNASATPEERLGELRDAATTNITALRLLANPSYGYHLTVGRAASGHVYRCNSMGGYLWSACCDDCVRVGAFDGDGDGVVCGDECIGAVGEDFRYGAGGVGMRYDAFHDLKTHLGLSAVLAAKHLVEAPQLPLDVSTPPPQTAVPELPPADAEEGQSRGSARRLLSTDEFDVRVAVAASTARRGVVLGSCKQGLMEPDYAAADAGSQVPASSLADCQAACLSDPDCVAVTVADGCRLHRGVYRTDAADAPQIYRVRCTQRCRWTAAGGHALHMLEDAAPSAQLGSDEECRNACELLPDCVGVSWSRSSSTCFFTRSNSTLSPSALFVSFVCDEVTPSVPPPSDVLPAVVDGSCAANWGRCRTHRGGACYNGLNRTYRCSCLLGWYCTYNCSDPGAPKVCAREEVVAVPPTPVPTTPASALPLCADDPHGCGSAANGTCYETPSGPVCGCLPGTRCIAHCSLTSVPHICEPEHCMDTLLGRANWGTLNAINRTALRPWHRPAYDGLFRVAERCADCGILQSALRACAWSDPAVTAKQRAALSDAHDFCGNRTAVTDALPGPAPLRDAWSRAVAAVLTSAGASAASPHVVTATQVRVSVDAVGAAKARRAVAFEHEEAAGGYAVVTREHRMSVLVPGAAPADSAAREFIPTILKTIGAPATAGRLLRVAAGECVGAAAERSCGVRVHFAVVVQESVTHADSGAVTGRSVTGNNLLVRAQRRQRLGRAASVLTAVLRGSSELAPLLLHVCHISDAATRCRGRCSAEAVAPADTDCGGKPVCGPSSCSGHGTGKGVYGSCVCACEYGFAGPKCGLCAFRGSYPNCLPEEVAAAVEDSGWALRTTVFRAAVATGIRAAEPALEEEITATLRPIGVVSARVSWVCAAEACPECGADAPPCSDDGSESYSRGSVVGVALAFRHNNSEAAIAMLNASIGVVNARQRVLVTERADTALPLLLLPAFLVTCLVALWALLRRRTPEVLLVAAKCTNLSGTYVLDRSIRAHGRPVWCQRGHGLLLMASPDGGWCLAAGVGADIVARTAVPCDAPPRRLRWADAAGCPIILEIIPSDPARP